MTAISSSRTESSEGRRVRRRAVGARDDLYNERDPVLSMRQTQQSDMSDDVPHKVLEGLLGNDDTGSNAGSGSGSDSDSDSDDGNDVRPSPTRTGHGGFITLVPGFMPTAIGNNGGDDDNDDDAPASPIRPPEESETPELPLVPIPPKPTTSDFEMPWPQLTYQPGKTTSTIDGVSPTQAPSLTEIGAPEQTEDTTPGSVDPITGGSRSGDSGMSDGATVGITLGVLIFVSLIVVAIVVFYRRRMRRGMPDNEAPNDRSLSQASGLPMQPPPMATQMAQTSLAPPPLRLQPPPIRTNMNAPAAPSSLRTWQTPSPDVPPEFATTGLFISQNPSSERVATPTRPPVSAANFRGYLSAQPSDQMAEPVSPLSDFGEPDLPVNPRRNEALPSSNYYPRRYSQDLTAPSPGRWSLFPKNNG